MKQLSDHLFGYSLISGEDKILKYGDREAPVELRTIYLGQSAGIAVRNRKAARKEKTESTGIGLQNIEKLNNRQ